MCLFYIVIQEWLPEFEAEELFQVEGLGVPKFTVVLANSVKKLGDGEVGYKVSVVQFFQDGSIIISEKMFVLYLHIASLRRCTWGQLLVNIIVVYH